jgi:hypothetical protein
MSPGSGAADIQRRKIMLARKRVAGGGSGQRDDQTFIARYEKGAPWEGYADHEVLERYRQLAPELTPAEFAQAAQESLARLTPQDRLLFGEYLQGQAEWQGVPITGLTEHDTERRPPDSYFLAQTIADIQRREPLLLEQLMGVEGSTVDSPLAKSVLAGIVAAGSRYAPGHAR